MTDYKKYIYALRKCAKEHENDRTFTGNIIVSDLCRDTANLLETLEQEPKVGHWVKVHPLQADDGGAYMCSCCGTGDWGIKGTENFCPNCGAKMVEPQESEVQEDGKA